MCLIPQRISQIERLFDSSKKVLRFLIGSDLHGHYLDEPSWKSLLSVAKYGDFDGIILNGDVADFSQISKHDKTIGSYDREFADEVTLDEEILFIHRNIWAPLRQAFPKKPIIMRLGNHETRWLKVAERNGDALLQMMKTMKKHGSVYLEDVLATDKFGVKISYNGIDRLFDTFTLIHGVKCNPTVAKANLLKYGSGTSGHTHRANAWTQVMRGRIEGWWESGCLRKTKDVEYLPMGDMPDWTNAFVTLTIYPSTGQFFCTPHFIINGQCDFQEQIHPLVHARPIRPHRQPDQQKERKDRGASRKPVVAGQKRKAEGRRGGGAVGTDSTKGRNIWSAIRTAITR